jgi:hypothetical protein
LSTVLAALLTATLLFLAFGHHNFYGIPAKTAAVVAAILLLVQLLPLDGPFYGFLLRRRGVVFVMRAVPVHMLYYLYSGTTFAACWVWHQISASPSSRPKPLT